MRKGNAGGTGGGLTNPVIGDLIVTGALTADQGIVSGTDPAFPQGLVMQTLRIAGNFVINSGFLYRVDATGGTRTMTLPAPAFCKGALLAFIKADTSTNPVRLSTPAGVIGVAGGATYDVVVPGGAVILESDGTDWNFLAGGPVTRATVTKTFADTGLTLSSEYVVRWNTAGGLCVCNLPAAAGVIGRMYIIKNIPGGGFAVNLTPNGADTIEGYAGVCPLGPGDSWMIQANPAGNGWDLL